MDELMQYLYNDPIIDDVVRGVTYKCIGISEALIPIFFAFSAVWDLIKSKFEALDGARPNYFSKKELARLAVLMAMAGPLYLAIFWPLANIGQAIDKATRPTQSEIVGGTTYNGKQHELYKGETGPLTNKDGGTAEKTEGQGEDNHNISLLSLFNIFSVEKILVGGFFVLLTGIISVVVKLTAVMVSKVLFVIGPLVIAFSMLKPFEGKMANWFGVYLTCLLVPLTINILDTILYSSLVAHVKGTITTGPAELAFNVVMVILYCLTFWVTSFVCGSAEAGKVLSVASALGSQAVNYYMMAARGAGGAVAGAAGSAGGDIISDGANAAKSAS